MKKEEHIGSSVLLLWTNFWF